MTLAALHSRDASLEGIRKAFVEKKRSYQALKHSSAETRSDLETNSPKSDLRYHANINESSTILNRSFDASMYHQNNFQCRL